MILGLQGAQGIQGIQGIQGNDGVGAPGGFGGVTFDYTFETATTPMSLFDVGKIRFNNTNASASTEMFIHERDDSNVNIETYLRTIADSTSTIKGHFKITEVNDASQFVLFTIAALWQKMALYLL